jgi:hypothetical protein
MKAILVALLWLFACGGNPDQGPTAPEVPTKPAPSKPAACPALEQELPYPCATPGQTCRFRTVGVLTSCVCLATGSEDCAVIY